MLERVQKILAAAGIASRRKCEELIAQGKVAVNGRTISLGDHADPAKDAITVAGRRVQLEEKAYLLLHKPPGFVTTVSEPFGMRTVMELVRVPQRVYPVGRLDIDAEGLLLLMNDGTLAHRLTHPRFEMEKEYEAVLGAPLTSDAIASLRKGVRIDGRLVQVHRLAIEGRTAWVRLHEGRKHIVKRLFAKLGYRVRRLKRTALGPLQLGSLSQGTWRPLTQREVEMLRRAAGVQG
jgi:23S rRNA pseudouridine2605 synthase